MQINRSQPAIPEAIVQLNFMGKSRIQKRPGDHPQSQLQAAGPVDATEVRVSAKPGTNGSHQGLRMLAFIPRVCQRRKVLVTIYFPNVLNVADFFGTANIKPTRKPPLHLLVVAVFVVPVEIKFHRELEIEDLDTFHLGTTIVK